MLVIFSCQHDTLCILRYVFIEIDNKNDLRHDVYRGHSSPSSPICDVMLINVAWAEFAASQLATRMPPPHTQV